MKKKNQNNIVASLNKILSDAHCQYTHSRACMTLEKIRESITEEEYQTIKKHLIWTNSENPDVWNWHGHGVTHEQLYQYKLFSKTIKSLAEKYESASQ